MFIEQPAFLVASLFERKSKPKGKKEREKGRGGGRNNGLIQCFSLHLRTLLTKMLRSEKIGNEK